tara:strand:- start:6277 stop:7257 length:981 start_codon:yes stop_codon:yes gene_type:complete
MQEKILFRCDAGSIKEVGTGHLIRSISVADQLVRSKIIKKENISFLIKSKNKFLIAKKILKKEKFRFKTLNNSIKDYSKEELNEILKNTFKIIIFDRLGKISSNFINKLKLNKKKIVCFDDSSKNRFKCDLSFNPLVFKTGYKKKNHFGGHLYNILPSQTLSLQKRKIKEIKKILLSFGGFDNKNLIKIFKNIPSLSKKYKFMLYNKTTKVNYMNRLEFYKTMNKCDLVFCAGGLTMFDAINLNKLVISIDQYSHQKNNIDKLKKKGVVEYFDIKKRKNIISLINSLNLKSKINYKMKKIMIYNKSQKFKTVINKIKNLYEYPKSK